MVAAESFSDLFNIFVIMLASYWIFVRYSRPLTRTTGCHPVRMLMLLWERRYGSLGAAAFRPVYQKIFAIHLALQQQPPPPQQQRPQQQQQGGSEPG